MKDSRYWKGWLTVNDTISLKDSNKRTLKIEQEEYPMLTNQNSYEQLPIMLNANTLAKTLGISRAGAYELMNSKGFPTLRIGKRMMVGKEQFIKWVNSKSGEAV